MGQRRKINPKNLGFSAAVRGRCHFSESAICSSQVRPRLKINLNFEFKTLRRRLLRWRLTLSKWCHSVENPFKTSAKHKRFRGHNSQPRPQPRLSSQLQGAAKPDFQIVHFLLQSPTGAPSSASTAAAAQQRGLDKGEQPQSGGG